MAGLAEMMVAGVLRADNYQRAKKFYTEVLGLKVGQEFPEPTPGGMFAAGSGSAFFLYERPGMPPPQNTTLGFAIPAEKFDAVVAELRGKGVVLEDYNIPEIGLKTVDGIAELEGSKSAWLKDTEGNIINIVVM